MEATTAQNIYDTPGFFAAYGRLDRSVRGLDGAPEWPAVRALLPPLAGARVVDLGCGFGWFARWAAARGAAAVLGLDLSENMLARARADTADPAVRYRRADLDALSLPEAAFDLAHSALCLHYVTDLGRLLRTVARALRPGGDLVFTVEHPILMASTDAGWLTRPDGGRTWPVDHYFREGERVTDWLAPGVVKQHRTLGTTLEAVLDAGLTLRAVREWCPTAEQVAGRPALAAELERPMFLLVSARR